MTERHEDPLGDLGRALDRVEPSPGFAARVRHRAALEAAAPYRDWRWVGGVAMAATLVVAVVLTRDRQAPAPVTRQVTTAAAAAAPSPAAAAPQTLQAVGGRAPGQRLSAGLPEPLIDSAQAEGLERLRVEIARGRIVMPVPVDPPGGAIDVAPIGAATAIAFDDIRIAPLSIDVFPTPARY